MSVRRRLRDLRTAACSRLRLSAQWGRVRERHLHHGGQLNVALLHVDEADVDAEEEERPEEIDVVFTRRLALHDLPDQPLELLLSKGGARLGGFSQTCARMVFQQNSCTSNI